MILKKVVLNGFKSFADRTEIPIDQGITVIVGPNGCGKSNISDAVRWVLGEQNPRNLRGGRMNDLIFGGTANRKQKGMAEVTLLMDNASGLLPVPYKEVEVTRRVFGDGESEYLINGSKVRLKDVQDLFLDTGMGTDTYSVMEQGKVERIISSKPRERRQLFEEAAGITKYRIRQEEAVRKLKRTESDLIRIRDIIGELERQVRSLSRQAKRAERYREIAAEMKQKEVALIYLDYRTRSDLLDTIEAELREMGDRQLKLKSQRAGRESMLEGIQTSWTQLTDELRDLKERHYMLQGEIEKREQGIRHYRERLGDLDLTEDRLKREIAGSTERYDAETRRIDELRQGLGALEEEVARIAQDADQALQDFQQVNAAARYKRAEVEHLRNQMLDAENAASAARNEIRQVEREVELHEIQRERLVVDRESAEVEKVALTAELARLQDEIARADERRLRLGERIAQLKEQLAEKEARQESEQKRASEVRSELASKRHRLQFLEDLQARHEGYEEGTRRVLEGKERGESPYVAMQRVLTEALSVEPRYETALESALREELQYLLCESGPEALQVLEALRESGDGRTSVLPFEHLRQSAVGHGTVPAADGGDNPVRAAEVVRCEDRFRELVQTLIGDLLIVNDLDHALRLYRQNPNGWRYVTLEGDLLSSKGVITGGKRETAGPLARWQEMHRLREEIKGLERSLFEIELVHGQVGEEVAGIRTGLNEARHEDHQVEVRRAALGKELDGLVRENQRIDRVRAMINGEVEAIDKHLVKFRERRGEQEEKLQRAAAEVERLQAAFAESETGLTDMEERLNDSTERRNASEVRLMERRKDLERERREMETASAQVKDILELNQMRQTEIENVRKRRGESEAAIRKAEEEIARLFGERDNFAELVRKKEEAVESEAARRKQMAAELQKIEEERNTLQEVFAKRESEKVRLDVERSNYERRLREDFSTSIEECRARENEVDFRRPVEELREETAELRDRIQRLGIVNELAIEEYEEVKERYDFHLAQAEDLEKARRSLLRTIAEIKKQTKERFISVFEQIRENFQHTFRQMFAGGKADLLILEEEGVDFMDAGIEVVVQPPGKKLQSIMLLSGGEKACAAIALLFAIYTLKPSPFCLLDEVDAPLDDTNVQRFGNILGRFTDRSQFLIISHNKLTMSMANRIHGVTMEERGVSTIVSVAFGDEDERNRPGVREVSRAERQDSPDEPTRRRRRRLLPDVDVKPDDEDVAEASEASSSALPATAPIEDELEDSRDSVGAGVGVESPPPDSSPEAEDAS